MKIVNFGSLNLDHVYRVPHAVATGETLAAASFQILLGGKGLNQSVAIARAGADVVHGGFVGGDPKAKDLLVCLEESGVDISKIRPTEEPQGHALIQVNDEGDNCIVIYGGSNQCVSKEYIDEVLADFAAGDFVVLQNETSNVEYAIEQAYAKGCSVVLNASPIDARMLALDFNKVGWLVINEIEGAAIAGVEGIDAIIPTLVAKYPKLNIVLTLGEDGSRCWTDGQEYAQNAFKAKAVDTTAAGDTFLGYVVAGLVAGRPMQQILRTASAASAIAVSIMGAAGSIPRYEEVQKYLENL